MIQVADRLYVIPQGGGNTAVFVASNGVIVVDPKVPENGEAVVAAIRTVTDKPITYVVTTHAHGDHFGGVGAMPAGAQVVAQERTARNIAKLRRTGDPHTFDGRSVRTFGEAMTLLEGPDAVDLFYFGRAHTDGDALVVFRAAGVMLAGDMFPGKTNPIINLPWGGDPREYPATIRRAVTHIKGVDRVITGHGPVLHWEDFVKYGEFNQQLLEHIQREMALGHEWNQALESFVVAPEFSDYRLDRLWGTVQDMYKGLTPWWHVWE
jgi:cyclase